MDDDELPPLPLGSAHATESAPPDDHEEAPAAILWIPSPEYRSGWREYTVRRQKEVRSSQPPRRAGFVR